MQDFLEKKSHKISPALPVQFPNIVPVPDCKVDGLGEDDIAEDIREDEDEEAEGKDDGADAARARRLAQGIVAVSHWPPKSPLGRLCRDDELINR
jgi:hypothetical protein